VAFATESAGDTVDNDIENRFAFHHCTIRSTTVSETASSASLQQQIERELDALARVRIGCANRLSYVTAMYPFTQTDPVKPAICMIDRVSRLQVTCREFLENLIERPPSPQQDVCLIVRGCELVKIPSHDA
jgi:hypothetical protein